jgi:hypothetical protein
MKILSLTFVCFVASCFGQQPSIDKAFFGTWNLDVAKSKFPGQAPKGGQAVINQNGYIATLQDPAPGTAPAVAVALVRGECYIIGHLGMSCTADTSNPRRGLLNIKLGDTPFQKVESELKGETTLTVKTTTLTSPNGPLVTEGVYTKAAQPPAPAKK